ncbi:MAG: hypothetical protein JSW16_04640 [Dehalococcoidales bacterium]|nr:MAG: hypothetical protein JSW16_04640 [Dehalococcoidales bacterium]
MGNLITEYRCELVANPHSHGSGRYGIRVMLTNDISTVFPYLNAVLDGTWYDHENSIFIGMVRRYRCAFRPHEIQVAANADPTTMPLIVSEVVSQVNQVWEERDGIEPSFTERKLPPVYHIFRLLPRTNCKQCGYTTCLAFAADLRDDKVLLQQCPPLSRPENKGIRRQIVALFPSGLETGGN